MVQRDDLQSRIDKADAEKGQLEEELSSLKAKLVESEEQRKKAEDANSSTESAQQIQDLQAQLAAAQEAAQKEAEARAAATRESLENQGDEIQQRHAARSSQVWARVLCDLVCRWTGLFWASLSK